MNNHYQLYLDAVITLAETMVVKFDDVAEGLNKQVMRDHGADAVNENDKSTWKYYQNISGDYHFSDPMIQVVSLDTGETIDFTKQNLTIHLATRDAYAFGQRHYKELVQNHPGQELLIIGILNPADINVAIAAQEGQILTYSKDLVEANEYSLIDRLQDWIYRHLDRWVNRAFTLTDDLYAASYIAQLFSLMVQAIITFRKQACKTNEAHSFHVQQYLASHSGLDVYLDKMTKAQALWFYRNILYVQRHAGKQDTFDWLVENVFTTRRLPLYAYTMKHNAQDMGRDNLSDNRLTPAVEFNRTGINYYARANEIETYSLDQVFAKLEDIAKGNPQYQLDHGEQIRDEFAYSASGTSVTKLLECSVKDYRDAVVYTLESILFYHWLGMVARKLYISTITVQLPASGDSLQLAPQDAVALFLYAAHMAAATPGNTNYQPLTRIPKFKVSRLLRMQKPSFAELRSITDKKTFSDAEIQQVLDSSMGMRQIVAIQTFYQYCVDLQQSMLLQHQFYASKDDHFARAQGQMIASRLYDDDTLMLPDLKDPNDPTQGQLYSQFLGVRGLDFANYTPQDFYNLAGSIVSEATGVNDLRYTSLSSLQKAMVDTFLKLSSYSIQTVRDINSTAIVVVEIPPLRPGTRSATETERMRWYVPAAAMDVIGQRVKTQFVEKIELIDVVRPKEIGHWKAKDHAQITLPPLIHVKQAIRPTTPYQLYRGLDFTSNWDVKAMTTGFSAVQQANLVDVYSQWPDQVVDRLTRVLPGFTMISGHGKALNSFTQYMQRKALPDRSFYNPEKPISSFNYYRVRRNLDISWTH